MALAMVLAMAKVYAAPPILNLGATIRANLFNTALSHGNMFILAICVAINQ
jgi:hypothetical protein